MIRIYACDAFARFIRKDRFPRSSHYLFAAYPCLTDLSFQRRLRGMAENGLGVFSEKESKGIGRKVETSVSPRFSFRRHTFFPWHSVRRGKSVIAGGYLFTTVRGSLNGDEKEGRKKGERREKEKLLVLVRCRGVAYTRRECTLPAVYFMQQRNGDDSLSRRKCLARKHDAPPNGGNGGDGCERRRRRRPTSRCLRQGFQR